MVRIKVTGSFRNTKKMLEQAEACDFSRILEKYAIEGVAALTLATPQDTGETANNWGYEIEYGKGKARIHWINKNMKDGVPIAILIQYGHATKNGGWVEGRDFINPAIQPIMDKIAEKAWREVVRV